MSFGPWSANAQTMPMGTCVRLASSKESARPNVGDGGRARFSGGTLPADGLVIDANAGDPSFAGRAFDPARPFTFSLESGFGVPPFDEVALAAPSPSLRWLDEPRIDPDGNLRLAWSSLDPTSTVVVVFQPDAGSDHLRCFFDGRDRGTTIPARGLDGLGSGTLTLASHRQHVVTPGAGWLVEVYAIAVVDERRFSLE